MKNLIKTFILLAGMAACQTPIMAQPKVTWDSHSLIFDGKRVAPVMGEIHYSRIPADEWETEVKKMKAGGCTMIATYVFWNHIEEIEDQWDWSGQRDLRRFLEICKKEQMPVVLRIGPFCHGEVRNGGIPDWFFTKGIKSRSEDPRFLKIAEKLYRQIFAQIQGLQWKDGGPLVACQFDNEYRGKGSYLMALKKIALNIGFDLPFYTRTGWPELTKPVPYGEMLPLYGDYADGFWERSIKPTSGNYFKAFFFKPNRDNKTIGNESLTLESLSLALSKGEGKNKSLNTQASSQTTSQSVSASPSPSERAGERLSGERLYPYFTCELGGGMMTAYHRRPYMYPNDAYAMAVVKLGSGSNLLGYYMYHGGTNPEGKLTYLNENQRTAATNYNDLPVKTYDFQAPLGEFGQVNDVFYRLRPLHIFMHDFEETLAPMDAYFPTSGKEIKKGEDTYLRWSYRASLPLAPSKGGGKSTTSAFVFFNNYERLQKLTAKKNVQFDVCGVKFPSKPMTIPADAIGVFPVNVAGIKYATAQLVANREGKIYLMQIKGIPAEIAFEGGKTIKNAKLKGTAKPIYKNYYLLNEDEAEKLFLDKDWQRKTTTTALTFSKTKEAGPLRTITIGVNKVAEEPTDSDFENAAVYTIDLSEIINLNAQSPKLNAQSSMLKAQCSKLKGLLDIEYHGDCARLYANGKFIDDNFYNGRHFQYGLWRLPKGTTKLELHILPMQKDEPVYFPKEADTTPGEGVKSISIIE